MSTLDLCEKYFETRNVYHVFNLQKECSIEQGKRVFIMYILCRIYNKHYSNLLVCKAYKKLCLKVHPDRVGERSKEEAGEKFKLVTKLREILSNSRSRAIYDNEGVICEDEDVDYVETDAACVSNNDLIEIKGLYKSMNLCFYVMFHSLLTSTNRMFRTDSDRELEDIRVAYLANNSPQQKTAKESKI